MYTKAKVYCCFCKTRVIAKVAWGKDVHPFNKKLKKLKFWKCPTCYNHVGCHKETGEPLGSIAFKELRIARRDIHLLLDPLWQSGQFTRELLYSKISTELGYRYHTGEIDSIEEARMVWHIIEKYYRE